MRKRNCELTSIRSSAFWMPRSKLPAARPCWKNGSRSLQVHVGDRPAVGAPRQRRQDLVAHAISSASSRLVAPKPGGRRRTADEDAPPARRVARRAGAVRPADRHRRDGRLRAAAARARPQRRLVARFGPLHERHADEPRARLDRQRKLEPRFRRAAAPSSAAAAASRRATDRFELHALAVHRDLELVRFARGAAGELHLHRVGAVHREVAAHRQPAARAERQIVHALVLRVLGIERVDVHEHRQRGVADREAADLLRRIEIALHRARRHEQQVGDGVEAAADVVGGQQVVDAHFLRQVAEREQIADRVAILGAAEPMRERQLADLRARGRRAIEHRLDGRRHGVVGGLVGPRRARRRHGRRAQLLDDLLPAVRVLGRRRASCAGSMHESRGLQPLVVAGDAVACEHCSRV